MDYVRFEKVSLKHHPEFNEKWLQEKIADDPSILGLGELILKGKEIPQPNAGRLDLLLQDPDSGQRFEVEIQLGKTDESHIIRTIEYWDIEKKRYPQYDHTAVLVAEDVTSRFLNVISLFNGFIPLVAIQLNCIKIENKVSLVATTVLNQMPLGPGDDEQEEPVDRGYWESKGTKETVSLADKVLEIIRGFAPGYQLKYNKVYIGLASDGKPSNFITLKPQKKVLLMAIKLSKSDDVQNILDQAELDLLDYTKWGRYRIRLSADDLERHQEVFRDLLEKSYEEFVS